MLQEEEEEEEGGSMGDADRGQQEETEETRSASTPTSTSIIEHCLVDWGSKRCVKAMTRGRRGEYFQPQVVLVGPLSHRSTYPPSPPATLFR